MRSIHFKLKKIKGFTLIEALVTVSVLSVMLMLAAPYLQDFFVKNKMKKISNDFTSSIFKAKNTAVSKNTCAMMCMSTSTSSANPSCAGSGSDWQPGWIVFLNTSCDSAINAPSSSDDLLEVRVSDGSEYFLQSQSSSPTRKISFGPRGLNTLGNADEFDLIYKTANHPFNEKFGMNICLDALGRTRTIPSLKKCSNYQ